MAVTTARAAIARIALNSTEDARRVIAQHLHSDMGGRCLACGEVEPCRPRDLAHSVLFGNGRQLPRRSPLALVRGNGTVAPGSAPFFAFGRLR